MEQQEAVRDDVGYWYEDHVIEIATGKRFALFVPWRADWADCDIPPALILTEEERRAAWQGVTLTDSHRGGSTEEWQLRERARRKQIREERRAKAAVSLARLKARHAGERYDRKLKQWVKDDDVLHAGSGETAEGESGAPEDDGDTP